MKKLFLFTLVIILTSSAYAQPDPQSNIEKQVLLLQQELPGFQKIVKVDGPEGFRHVYTKDGEVQVIQVKSIEALTEKNVSWYYQNGHMIFAETKWVDHSGKVTFSDKLYLENDHMIAWIRNGKPESTASSRFMEMDSSLVAYGKRIRLTALE